MPRVSSDAPEYLDGKEMDTRGGKRIAAIEIAWLSSVALPASNEMKSQNRQSVFDIGIARRSGEYSAVRSTKYSVVEEKIYASVCSKITAPQSHYPITSQRM